ncbi:MAG: hypothetical protein M1818_006429 [Claussenomyces sp. TS43310]|nr:MAG: hypothetical protein M1818_006429 [Claussenomyces sp. TS43310]
MATDYKFEGWMGLDKSSAEGKMVWQEFTPKPWSESDVDIQVTHCGICGSDLHTLRSGWGATAYPCCVGHEVVGKAVRVGSEVKHIKVGDRCGVGAQSSACLRPDCEACANGKSNYCPNNVGTYNSHYPDGSKSYGGYSTYSRVPGPFVIPIPDEISSAEAAPMLCGGVTTYTPLVNNGAGPGKKVGIIGIGGLGHFGVLWAKALDCDKVVAISRSHSKEADALKMGADEYIATDDKDWATKNASSLDLIISTISSPKMPLQEFLGLLRTDGQFIQVGAPEDVLPAFNVFTLITKAAKIGGSMIGTPSQIKDMLALAVKKNIHPYIEERPMKEANKAIVDMEDGKARYRYVLVN